MRTIWILFVLLNSTVQSRLKIDFVNHRRVSVPLQRVLLEILRVTDSHGVNLVIYEENSDNHFVVNEVSKRVSQFVPTEIVTRDMVVNNTQVLLSVDFSTILVFFYTSKEIPDEVETRNILETLRSLFFEQHLPKILIITAVNASNDRFEDFLRCMWDSWILDVTVLNLSSFEEEPITMEIHQFNPFSNVYKKEPFSSRVEWYPDKLIDMNGYPIKIDIFNRPAHSTVSFNSSGYPVTHEGPDASTLQIVRQVMNFTPVFSTGLDESRSQIVDTHGNLVGSMHRLLHGEIDALFTSLPVLPTVKKDSFSTTVPIEFENWCAVIPLIHKREHAGTWNLIKLLLTSLAIVIVFWITSYLLRFDIRLWRPTLMFSILLSISIPRTPKRIAERIVFIAVLSLSYTYTSLIYAELAKINFDADVELNLHTFEELEKTGLTLMLTDTMSGIFHTQKHTIPPVLLDNAIIVHKVENCWQYLLAHRNVSCFMEISRVMSLMSQNFRQDGERAKITDLCFWNPPVGYVFYRNSPYVKRVSDLVAVTQQIGLRSRFYVNFFKRFFNKINRSNDEKRQANAQILIRKLVTVAMIGYFVSLMAFVGEIAFSRWRKRRKCFASSYVAVRR